MIDAVTLQTILAQAGPLLEQGFMAQQQAALAPLESATQQAQGAAQQAQQAYLDAAQAPAPEANGFADQLAGGVASVLSGDAAHGQRAHARTEGRQNDLMEARRQNLTSLQSIYAQKADAAEKLGNMEMAEKARTSNERISRQLQQMDDEGKFRRTVEENKRKEGVDSGEKKLDRESAERIAGMRARTAAAAQANTTNEMNPETLRAMANEVLSGRINLTHLSGQRYKGNDSERDQVVRHLAENGQKIFPPKVRDTMNNLKAAEKVIDQLEALSRGTLNPKTGQYEGGVNTAEPGLFGVGALAHGLKKRGDAATQKDPKAARFDSTREAFLATLARATGEKGTLNEGDIKRAKKLLATFEDARGTATEKFAAIRQYLGDLRVSAVNSYTSVQPEQQPAGQSSAPADATQADLDYVNSLYGDE